MSPFDCRQSFLPTAAVLQEEGQPMAAIPHLVGILCGHVYHFFTVVHPLMGAKRRLGAPAWMKRRLDGGDNPNFMESSGDGGCIRYTQQK